MARDNLTIVGTGIRTVGQMTVESIACLESADRVYHVVADPVARHMIESIRPDGAISMIDHHEEGRAR